MVANRKVKGTASSIPVGVAFGATLSMMVTILGAAATAWAVLSEKISEPNIGYYVMAILIIGSFLGAMVATGKIKHRRAMVCGCVGTTYYALLLAITALFFGGQYEGFGITALMVFIGCGCALLLGLKPKREKGRRKIKIRSL